jgi:hypothetical protein
MFIFSFTALCFAGFVLYEQFIKRDPPDAAEPDEPEPGTDEYYVWEGGIHI